MNPLQRELQRLYGPAIDTRAAPELEQRGRVGAPARVRALVLEVARPADGRLLAAVGVGVQNDLALPAPAIAVNGSDGCQLWFSLLEPVPAREAGAFLEALRRRYLGAIALDRVALRPAPDASAPPSWPEPPVPAAQSAGGRWSAFVAPDLAAMFADEPWLDVQPNPEGQAQLLAPLQSIAPDAFALALQRLGTAGAVGAALSAPGPAPLPA
ncbi:MAG: hypothetical protein KGL18_15175, partial [Burkholderiales bacterium]|nr:hypothetical protein [Burkholderiales bacterium]